MITEALRSSSNLKQTDMRQTHSRRIMTKIVKHTIIKTYQFYTTEKKNSSDPFVNSYSNCVAEASGECKQKQISWVIKRIKLHICTCKSREIKSEISRKRSRNLNLSSRRWWFVTTIRAVWSLNLASGQDVKRGIERRRRKKRLREFFRFSLFYPFLP